MVHSISSDEETVRELGGSSQAPGPAGEGAPSEAGPGAVESNIYSTNTGQFTDQTASEDRESYEDFLQSFGPPAGGLNVNADNREDSNDEDDVQNTVNHAFFNTSFIQEDFGKLLSPCLPGKSEDHKYANSTAVTFDEISENDVQNTATEHMIFKEKANSVNTEFAKLLSPAPGGYHNFTNDMLDKFDANGQEDLQHTVIESYTLEEHRQHGVRALWISGVRPAGRR